ncbi:SH3 domain-containing protein [Cribrihabitans sp. XS_ASV171]
MNKFVLASFLFLGFAFYELSGGSDFEPRGTRPEPEERTARVEATKPKPNRQDRASEIVAKQVIAPRSTVKGLAGSRDGTPEETKTETGLNEGLMRVAAGYNTNFGLETNQGGTITLASLGRDPNALQVIAEEPRDDQQTAAESIAVEPQRDIRKVTGTRVNMRLGPGTTYPVISRLNLGHEVEVLESPGNGWLRLRVLPERTVGWISASLVGDKAD